MGLIVACIMREREREMVVMLHYIVCGLFLLYFFFKVKNDRFLGSSLFSMPAGRV